MQCAQMARQRPGRDAVVAQARFSDTRLTRVAFNITLDQFLFAQFNSTLLRAMRRLFRHDVDFVRPFYRVRW
jgi:hypothetical protein